MRSVRRVDLRPRTVGWLDKQVEDLMGDLTIDVKKRWGARRSTMNSDANGVANALKEMSGWRNRCMYCGDSEGSDIEHFYPKADPRWRSKVFDWENFLWICAPCNRLKNAAFPLDLASEPLLLNPVGINPWEYFDFVPETGYLVVRAGIAPHMTARASVSALETHTRLCHEVVLEERKRAFRQWARASQRFVDAGFSVAAEMAFIDACIDAGYPELGAWLFAPGMPDDPFRVVSLSSPESVDRLRRVLNDFFPSVW